MRPNGPREPVIGRQQLGIQSLGQCHIAGVVGAEVRAQVEHPFEQRQMAVPGERQQEVVLSGQLRPFVRDDAPHEGPAQAGDDFYVAQGRDPKVGLGKAEDLADRR
ncbi:MAG TPA: hypothetical protein VFW92_07595 [Candidatus Limnocylindrales bacterium]|nr:hypothetical protein [Candidatus Limnocylindrales bacterium]